MKKLLFLICFTVCVAGCSYVRTAVKQAKYYAQQRHSPSQRVYKHMLEVDNFFVFGKIGSETASNKGAIAVVALSDRSRENEVVDVSHFCRIGSYYGLHLPAGDYRLLVVNDLNQDGFYDETEVVGGKLLSLSKEASPEKVLGEFDIDLNVPFRSPSGASFRLMVQKSDELAASLFYPKGSIRSLEDEIFSQRMATLGVFEPAAFLEEAPMLFYALEENPGHKVPVVFVHGVGGTARDFAEIVSRLDRTLYQPWFFYYPSGADLGQLSEMFYNIFLSGKVIPLGDTPMVIVAHSMGGLVVRDALNRCTGSKGECKATRLITIASPMGGHPSAKIAAKALVIIPSWRDIDPESAFMRRLRRKALPDKLEYRLIYAYRNSNPIKLGDNSDGTVPLSSQLCVEAQNEATGQYGFNDNHTGILNNPDAIQRILKIISEVRPPYPEEHLRELVKGGYAVDLGKDYSPMEKHFIHTIGFYMAALASGAIEPMPGQLHFVQASRGEKTPENEAETAWIKFTRQYPDRSSFK